MVFSQTSVAARSNATKEEQLINDLPLHAIVNLLLLQMSPDMQLGKSKYKRYSVNRVRRVREQFES